MIYEFKTMEQCAQWLYDHYDSITIYGGSYKIIWELYSPHDYMALPLSELLIRWNGHHCKVYKSGNTKTLVFWHICRDKIEIKVS